MKPSDKLLAERKRLEHEEETLFYEHQEFKRLAEESEIIFSEIQHFQPQLENYFYGSQRMHHMESLYSESLSQGKQACFELNQTENDLKRGRHQYEDEIDKIQRKYYQALQNEEENKQ